MCRLEFANFIGDVALTALAPEVTKVKSHGDLVVTLGKLKWRPVKFRRGELVAYCPEGQKYKFSTPDGIFESSAPVRARKVL